MVQKKKSFRITRLLALPIATLCLATTSLSTVWAAEPSIVPRPSMVVEQKGSLMIADGTAIVVSPNDADAKATADYLVDLVARTRGIKLVVKAGSEKTPSAIVLTRTTGTETGNPESYSLDVRPNGVSISAGASAGQFYGAVTLWQLLTQATGNGPVTIEAVHIEDAPRLAWRGLLVDSARHMQTVDFLKQYIDWMALHKLNVFHWHLTDDQGWRIEIKKYPKLTEIGAWRVPAGAAGMQDIDPKTGKPRLYGGFYTQEQAKEIVAYAAARHITVLPEIDMPGHATAELASYPELGVSGVHVESPGSDWGVYENVLDVTNPKTLEFAEDVWSELLPIFPSTFVHIGGDEAQEKQWKELPEVQAKMKEFGLTNEFALQSRFIGQLDEFLTAKGRRLIGWDEILKGGTLASGATVMSWNGTEGAVTAAMAGHDTIVTPDGKLYLDHLQSAGPEYLPGRIVQLTLQQVYDYDGMPTGLSDQDRAHVLGVEAALWTEYMRTPERQVKMTWPRAAALAEATWTALPRHDYADFYRRMEVQEVRYKAIGLHDYGLPPLAPATAAEPKPGALPVKKVSQQLGFCGAPIVPFNIEGDWPIKGPRPLFKVDIFKPCWVYEGADLTHVGSVKISLAQIPYNYQLSGDREKVKANMPVPKTPEGELEVRLGADCKGDPIAVFPLKKLVGHPGLTTVEAPIAVPAGKQDVCFRATGKDIAPLTVVNTVAFGGKH